MSLFNWKHDGRRILLPVQILRPTPASDLTGVTVNALVDTGATATGIAARFARQLQLEGRGKKLLVSAQGVGYVERYLFRIGISANGESWPYIFDDVFGFELIDGSEIEAVLGMDILRQCDLRIMRDGSVSLATGQSQLK